MAGVSDKTQRVIDSRIDLSSPPPALQASAREHRLTTSSTSPSAPTRSLSKPQVAAGNSTAASSFYPAAEPTRNAAAVVVSPRNYCGGDNCGALVRVFSSAIGDDSPERAPTATYKTNTRKRKHNHGRIPRIQYTELDFGCERPIAGSGLTLRCRSSSAALISTPARQHDNAQ